MLFFPDWWTLFTLIMTYVMYRFYTSYMYEKPAIVAPKNWSDAPFDPFHLKSPFFSWVVCMRDAIVHLSWLLTHVARTLWGDHHTTGVVTALGEEVRVLQAELHRTHRILEGYSLIVEQGRDCHWAHRTMWCWHFCFGGLGIGRQKHLLLA